MEGERRRHGLVPVASIVADQEENDRFHLDSDGVRDLVDSIRSVGLINPVTLVKDGERYRLVCGFRRLLACRMLGWSEVPAYVLDDASMAVDTLRLDENLVRANLTAVEEARRVALLLETLGVDVDGLAARLGRRREWVEHRLAIAGYPQDVLRALHHGKISIGVADELAAVVDDGQRGALVAAAVQNGCTARQAALWRAEALASAAAGSDVTLSLTGPKFVGAPPVVTKACFVCEQRTPVTEQSFVSICGACMGELQGRVRQQDAGSP